MSVAHGRMDVVRSPTRTLAASTLVFEALVVFFAGLVAMQLSSLSRGVALGLACGLALAFVQRLAFVKRTAFAPPRSGNRAATAC